MHVGVQAGRASHGDRREGPRARRHPRNAKKCDFVGSLFRFCARARELTASHITLHTPNNTPMYVVRPFGIVLKPRSPGNPPYHLKPVFVQRLSGALGDR